VTPPCLSGASPRAAAPAGERPAHNRGDLRHGQRLWLEDITGALRIGLLFRIVLDSMPPLVAAGCEPRAGLCEMSSGKLHDDLPHPRVGAILTAALIASDSFRHHLQYTASRPSRRRLTHQRPGNKKRSHRDDRPHQLDAHLLAFMKKGEDVRPGQPGAPPGDQSPRGARGLSSRPLAVCADHATCMTPSHPVMQQAREGAQPDRRHQPGCP